MLNKYDKNMDKIDVIDKTISLSDIQTISKKCVRLLSTTERIRNINEDAFKNAEMLFPSLRKLFIASMMRNKRLICISGLQGAGKTTLMKNFYGITGDFMNVSLGTGERVPVLITENGDVNEPHVHAIAVRKDDDGNYKEITIEYKKDETEEIIRATSGEDETILYVEIIVPYKHTNNSCVSFMLLPGFEKKNDYWNDLIEFSVNSSDAAVFVFNETSFSNQGNEDYLKKIESRFGSNVIYAISGSDSSPDDNAQVKNTCMEVLKVKEPDKVVCVGQYPDVEKNNDWIVAFKTALDKYALYETQVTQKTTSYIFEELLNIKDTLYTILGSLRECEGFEETDFHNHKLLKAYDNAISKLRKELARHITDKFREAKDCSMKSVTNQLRSEPWYENLRRTFFGPNLKDYYIRTQEIISSSLKDGEISLPDKYLGESFRETIKYLDEPQNNNPNALQLLVDTKEIEDKTYTLILSNNTQDVIDDVCALIEVPKKNEERREIKSKNPDRLLRAVAEIATYYYGISSYECLAKSSGLASYEPAKAHITGDDIIKGADSSKKFAVGLAGVMGVDILGDGSLNLISQIATSCGVSLPIAGSAAVLIVGIGALQAVVKDINRMQRADVESARMTVLSIYDNIQQETLERFDNFTNEVRDRIEDNLADLGGERNKIITIYNATVETRNLLDFLDDITKDYREQSHGIGSFIS